MGGSAGRGAATAAGAGDCALVARFSGDGRGGVLWRAPRTARPGEPACKDDQWQQRQVGERRRRRV